MTRATLRFMESEIYNDYISKPDINDVFKMLSRKIYQTILIGPYLPRVQSKR